MTKIFYLLFYFVALIAAALNFLGRQLLYGDLPELIKHRFNEAWIVAECYRRQKQSPDNVGRLIIGPYLAQNLFSQMLISAPVPVLAAYGENVDDFDDKAREPFEVMRNAIKYPTIVNTTGQEAAEQRAKIKVHLYNMQSTQDNTLLYVKQRFARWNFAADFESQISLICTNIIARSVFGLPELSLEDIPILKKMSHEMVYSKPGSIAFEEASVQLINLSNRLFTTPEVLQSKKYLYEQLRPEQQLASSAEQMKILQDMHGGGGLIVESNLSALCTFALAKINENPLIKAKLLAELASVENIEDYNQLSNLPYLNAIYTEALRITSPTAVLVRKTGHRAMLRKITGNDGVVRDVAVPNGTFMFGSIRHLHMDPEFWPEPQLFNPERFMGEYVPSFESKHFCPFSSGIRSCPAGGQSVKVVFKLTIAQVFSKYDFQLDKPLENLAVVSNHPRLQQKYFMKVLVRKEELTDMKNHSLNKVFEGCVPTNDGGTGMKYAS